MQKTEPSMEQRRSLLQQAVVQLKQEFIGIDGIIDEIADAILPWWLFPQHQLRPLIINLWGMTGSGKTALVKRLSELIQYQNFLMRFDMGEFGTSTGVLKWTLTRNLAQFHEYAPIILLDEFQFAKTIDETGKEVNNYSLRIIWDLLDSGQLIYEPDGVNYYCMRAKNVLKMLNVLKGRGAKLKNGILTHLTNEVYETFTKYQFGYGDSLIDRTSNPIKPEEILISDVFCTGIYEMNQSLYINYNEVANEIRQMQSFDELIDFITAAYEREMSFKTMNLTKSLIFVVGNLDEAYVMSHVINPDIDADEFKRFTQKITVADIKKALQSRFRNEQIARLGNIHLIYHAFSHKDFEALIQMHLTEIADMAEERFGLKPVFSTALKDLLYAEGVFPTQGVRPVLSTIRNMVESNIAKIILHREEHAKSADRVQWDFQDDHYLIDFYKGKQKISHLRLPALQKINSLRKSTRNDLQALVAVHEAGHAIAAMFLVGIAPEYVITKTVDTDSQGFTYTILPEDIVTRKLLIAKIKLYLGGYVAEQCIFGKDDNTTGVVDDLRQVTALAQQIFRDYGMHGIPAKSNIHVYGGVPYQFTFGEELEQQAIDLIMSCLAEVHACIKEYETLLLEISLHLSNHSRIEKEDLIALSDAWHRRNKRKPVQFLTKDTYYDFRERLVKKHQEQITVKNRK